MKSRATFKPTMPKLISFKAIPKMLWVVLATGWIVMWGVKAFLGVPRGVAVGLLIVAACYVPRQVRVNWFTSAAFYLADDVLKLDQWTARSSNRWRSRIQKVGFQRDFSFWGQQTTAARKGKWIRLRLRPWFSLWPRPWHVAAVAVRIPPHRRVDGVLGDLTVAMAEFFDVPAGRVRHTVKRAWMRTWITFTVTAGPKVDRAKSFVDVLDRHAAGGRAS